MRTGDVRVHAVADGTGPRTGDTGAQTEDTRSQSGGTRLDTGDTASQTGDTRLHTGDTASQTGDTRLHTSDTRPHADDSPLHTGDAGPDTADPRLHTADSGPRTEDSRLHTGDTGPHTKDTEPHTEDTRPNTVGTPPPTADPEPSGDRPGDLPDDRVHPTVARNPVIRGFAPDPSLIRVGDWYYTATSSFEWFPTIPLHRSRDLAHWEYAGHVQGAAPGGTLAGVPDSGGIWAPSLSWDGERFWVVYAVVRSVGTPYFDLDTYVNTAPDVAGPWTEPRRVPGHGFDPALFHEDGRLWLLNLQNDHRPGGQRFAGIVLTELDRDTLAPRGGTHLLLQHERLIEGPKLISRDGWYHLVLAEGGTGFEHGVRTARSRRLTGPYELDDRPLLTSRDDPKLPLQKAGHAELVRTPGGEWFLSHLTARPLDTPHGPRCTLGRETAIQAVTWDTDGRPRLRQGGWHPAVEVEVPTSPTPHPRQPVAPQAPLGWPWSTLREPPDPSWADVTSRPGWIRLRGRHGPESRWAQSLLAQRLTEHRATAHVTVEARPSTFTQAAGLVLRYDAEAYLSLDLTWAEPEGEPQRGQQWRGEGQAGGGRTVLSVLERDERGARQAAVVEVDAGVPLTVGVSVDGAEARFWYVREGVRTPVGPPLDCGRLSDDHADRLRFTGTLVGIHARDLVDASFTADFRDFRLTCTPL